MNGQYDAPINTATGAVYVNPCQMLLNVFSALLCKSFHRLPHRHVTHQVRKLFKYKNDANGASIPLITALGYSRQ
jgi:hypothetical protein